MCLRKGGNARGRSQGMSGTPWPAMVGNDSEEGRGRSMTLLNHTHKWLWPAPACSLCMILESNNASADKAVAGSCVKNNVARRVGLVRFLVVGRWRRHRHYMPTEVTPGAWLSRMTTHKSVSTPATGHWGRRGRSPPQKEVVAVFWGAEQGCITWPLM